MGVRVKSSSPPPAKVARTSSGRASISWGDAPVEFVRRVAHIQIWGPTDSGRTSLALTGRGPVAYLHALEKYDGPLQDRQRTTGDVKIKCFGGVFPGSPDEAKAKAAPVMDDLEAHLYDALDPDSDFRSAILDTHTEAWELLRLASFGVINPTGYNMAFLYGPVNARWRSIMNRYREQTDLDIPEQDKCNLICIGQESEIYRDNKATGRYKQAGMKEMPYKADVIIQTGRNGNNFTATIRKGWWNAMSEGMVFEDGPGTPPEDRTIRLPFIMSLITETDEEEWT